MNTETLTDNESKVVIQPDFITGWIPSRDGTTIGYLQIGRGPGLVLVQGAMGTAQLFTQLGLALADTFTVYIPDRRGRGLSGHGKSDYSVQREVEDLQALFDQKGARYLFGLSAGALIALQATLSLSSIRKAAIYEPPLFTQGFPSALMARYEKEMAEGRLAAALVTAMQATQMGPQIFNLIPRALLELLTRRMMESEARNAKSGEMTMQRLAPTLQQDFEVVYEMSRKLETFRAVRQDVLLLGGSKSPEYLKEDLGALEKALPHVRRVEFPGLDHAAAWNTDRQRNPGGRPGLVAQELKRFFAGS